MLVVLVANGRGTILADVELNEGQQQTIGLLALVAGQDLGPGDYEGTWRIARHTTPDRVVATRLNSSR